MDAIVAVDARWGIGRDGGLLFRISAHETLAMDFASL